MTFDLESKGVVFVTGAGSGIGRSIALALADAGWAVGVFDRDPDGAQSTVAEITRGIPDKAVCLIGDVTHATDVETAVAATVARFGPLTAAVANAGIWMPGSALDLSDEEWDRAISVNLTGAFLTARAAMKHLVGRDGSSFVAVSSDAGVTGSQNCAAYIASKHAVIGLVRSLALDFGPRGVRSNAVCPGFVSTPLADEVFTSGSAELKAARQAEVPLGRFAEPREIGDLVAFLLSPQASFINGASILCDGGSSSGYFHAEAFNGETLR
jgi:NAD(P)-dependent dehydrogenase (short-subunit alcohol dehydrogenase family)